MKVFLCVIFLLLNSFSFAQSEANNKVEAKEKVLLQKIEDALKANEYELAEELLTKLNKLKKNKKNTEIDFFKNGFYAEAMLGLGILPGNGMNSTYSFLSPSLRFGNKWYFGKNERSKTGINLIYLRPTMFFTTTNLALSSKLIGVQVNSKIHLALLSNSLLNLGFTHLELFKKKQSAIEFNFNTGFNILSEINKTSFIYTGINLNPGLSIRTKKLNFGLDYLGTFFFVNKSSISSHVVSFSFGANF